MKNCVESWKSLYLNIHINKYYEKHINMFIFKLIQLVRLFLFVIVLFEETRIQYTFATMMVY